MMAQKHLHELLKQDQEPFLLTNFIADKRSLLKRPSPKTHLQLKKRKPISETSDFPGKFCKNACFFSFHDSPDLRKSPLIEFQSPAKSPCRNSNAIFLHIPARTAGLLLAAALRIQKQSSSSRSKTQSRSNGFGLLGSFLKRLTHRSRPRKRGIQDDGVNDSSVGRIKLSGGSPALPYKMAIEDDDSVSHQRNTADFDFCESNFCDSPFRFVLQSSNSPGHQTPEFSSPVTSPTRHDNEDNKNSDVESLKKLQVEDEEEEKEQSSPVSVLDPPFEDDDDGHYEDGEDEDEDNYNLECSYSIVQKAKQQLLKKLRRFEKLAELDPIELEKFLLEEEEDEIDDDDDDIDHLKEEECETHNIHGCDNENNTKQDDKEADGSSSFQNPHLLAKDTNTLVSDLIGEEGRDRVVIDNREEMVKKVYMRLESWKGMDSNTIDMMVEQDFKSELDGWNRSQEQKGEMAIEIELAIFSFLVEEVQTELDCSTH